ncbi:MBL fold metallo-hydrolase [Aliikangiella sp. IMCC44359]|uniref:MBL fold metallo-hydrolase n=1 Tax=Aliikangiella sp. IMCC44359 TaxID=3459125 RepID=UPI00403AEA2F
MRLIGLIFFSLFSLYLSAAETVKLNRYTSLEGWRVNSYWIETPKSIVIIDTQLLPEDAKKLASTIKLTGKPVKSVFITHPHPDHFAGLAVLEDEFGHFDIYASRKTAIKMEIALKQFLSSGFSKPFGERVEKRYVAANKLVRNGERVKIDGLTFKLDDLGPGEAENNSVIHVEQKNWLFTGDVTMHYMHYYLGEGRSQSVLKQLLYLKENYPDEYYYTGHGEPARSNILDSHIEYVQFIRNKVFQKISDKSHLNEDKTHLTSGKRHELVMNILKQYPDLGDYGFDAKKILAMSIYGVEAELLSHKK